MIISRNENVKHASKGDGYVLNDLETGISTELNEVAFQIWNMAKEGLPIELIAEKLAAEYAVDIAEATQDVTEIVFSLIKGGMVKVNRDAVYVPYSSWKYGGNDHIVYFPTQRISLFANEAFVQGLRNAAVQRLSELDSVTIDSDLKMVLSRLGILNVPYSEDEYEKYKCHIPRRAVLIPTTDCDLDCSYCYAKYKGKKKYYMTKLIARAAIDYVIENSVRLGSPSVDLSFMGGGEPTRNWDVLTYAVKYAQEQAEALSVPLTTMLTTNGVLSDKQIDWLIENIGFVKVSFDGIREIQNTQRPLPGSDSFGVVTHTLRRLSDSRSEFLIRCTVTNSSLSRLAESVQFILHNFTPTSIIVNPVYVCGSCTSHGIESIDLRAFCAQFEMVEDAGNDYGIDIIVPYDKLTYMETPKTPFCGFEKGNYFVTPDGYLSACSEIDSADDVRSAIFFFGKWDPASGKMIINDEKLKQLHDITTRPLSRCGDCKSSTFCPGHCLVRKVSEETLSLLLQIKDGTDPTQELNDKQIVAIYKGQPSRESDIQCAITNRLSRTQAIRAVTKNDVLDKLTVDYEEVNPGGTLSAGKYTVHKAVKISLPGES